MAIDPRFLNISKDRLSAVRRAGMQFVQQNHKLSLGSAGAMLLAPAIYKNDNRGYFQTAAITTPLIAAGTYALPSVIGAFRSQFSKHGVPSVTQSVSEAWTGNKAKYASDLAGIRQATQDYASGSTPLNVMQDVERRHFSGRMGRAPDLTEESSALKGHLAKLFAADSKTPLTANQLDYISSAIHAEKIHALSASDLLAYQNSIGGVGTTPMEQYFTGGSSLLSPTGPRLLPDAMRPAIEEYMGNLTFVRGMRYRLAKMNRLTFTGQETVMPEAVASMRATRAGYSTGLMAKLKAASPELYAEVSEFTGKEELKFSLMEGAGHPIAAIHYGKLTVPVVRADGTVLTGKGLQRVAVAQKVYTADHMMASDVYAFASLNRGIRTETIAKELQRANIIAGIEVEPGEWVTSNLGEGATVVDSAGAKFVRQRTAIPSHAWGFGPTGATVGWNKLDAEASTAATVAAAHRHKLTALGPESGPAKGKLQFAEMSALAPFGEASVEKQDPTIRAIAKNVSFGRDPQFGLGGAVPGHPTGTRPYLSIRDKLNVPFFRTDYLETAAAHIDQRGMALRVAGITGGEKTLFGDLPETVAGLAGYEETAVGLIQKERGVSTIAARKMWTEMSQWLSVPENLRAMRVTGTLGEGGIIMRNNLNGMGVEQTVRYKVHKPMVGDWQSYMGQDVESVFGNKKGSKVLLGMYGDNPVTAGGTKNYIQNVHNMGLDEAGNPLYELEVKEWHPLRTGTKVDVGGIKGLVSGVSDDQMRRLKIGMNRWYKATGTGGYIPIETEGISVLHYSQNKRDQVKALMETTGDTLRRLEDTGELEQLRPHLAKLEQYGFSYSQGDFIQKSAVGSKYKQESLDTLEAMFNDISERLIDHRMNGDNFMQHYAAHMSKFDRGHKARPAEGLTQEGSYLQYAFHHAAPAWTQAWNTTQINVPKETKFTYDMMQQLKTKGYYGALEDIQSRLGYEGDLRMNREMESYLGGDTSALTRTIKMEEGLNETGFLKKMSTPEGRAGTFFDEGFGRTAGKKDGPYDANYLMELPDGSKVPVLGHAAYGGKTNRFGATFSASDHERKLMELMRLYRNGTPSAAGLKTAEKVKGEYLDEIKKFVIGKESYLRADAIDEVGGLGQFIQTRASTLRYENGEVNPFEVGIGRDQVRKLDRETRAALRRTDPLHKTYDPNAPDVYAAVTRHPVSDMPFVRVKIDHNLDNTNIVGMDEGMRSMLMADDDGDMIWGFFMRQKNTARGLSGAGAEEAAKAVAGTTDKSQRVMLDWMQSLGNKDDPRKLAAEDMQLGSIIGGLKKGAKGGARWASPRSLDAALRARSTSGSIGAFSNTLTEMLIGVEANEGLLATGDKTRMARYLFDVVRQGPISAAKSKYDGASIFRPMNLARARGINASLNQGMAMGGEQGYYKWRGAMRELADATAEPGKGVSAQRALFDQFEETMFKPYFHGMYKQRKEIHEAARAFTMSKGAAAKATQFGVSENLLAYAQAAAADAQAAEEVAAAPTVVGRTASAGAQMSAEALGAWNRGAAAFRQAGGEMRRNGVGMVLGLGVAVAAAAGIATGTMDKRGTSALRPDDRAGVSDQAPGGAWEGSMASRPRRSLIESAPQMRTSMVAPIQETADMDVRMRAKDRSRAHETAKIMSQIATRGDSNVTINYTGQNRRTLRSKERLRSAMEED